jgi:uncharacterized protein with von Willebrand factor type A (vWA) domain
MSTNESNVNLSARDYKLMIDKSGSMGTKDQPGGTSRWNAAKEMTISLARKITEFDADGIEVITFNNSSKETKGVKDENEVERIFKEEEPNYGTNLYDPLKKVLDDHLANVATNKPLTVLIITDGEPERKEDVKRLIADCTTKMTADEQLALQFVQIGNNAEARAFLKELDDELVPKYGAKFDIVDTKNDADMANLTIVDLLTAAVTD